MDLSHKNIHIFLEKYGIKNENGVKLDFHSRPFLWDIYEDMSDKQVVIKAPQIGLTTLQLIKSLYVAKYKHYDIIYTLPSASDIGEMVSGKLNRIIAQNPIFDTWVADKDSVEQKAVGDNRIYYRGTWTTRAAMMVTSQLNIHDEIDASNTQVITQYETRQQAQEQVRIWNFSHPSVVGNGVDISWNKSDMKEWFVTCVCGKEQMLEFPASIDSKRECYQCKYCQAEITDLQRIKGKWKKRYKDKEWSGYHISQLMCSWIPASKILKDHREKDIQYFTNMVLALPYADAGNTVTWDVIERNIRPTERSGRVIIGVDPGIDIRFVVGDKGGLIEYGEVKSWTDFERVIKRYPDCIVISDQGGDIIGPRELQEKYAGRFFLCYFQQDRKTMQLIKWGEHEESGKVMADRNRLIQLVVDEFNDNRIPLKAGKDWHPYYLHWSHIYRLMEEDKITKQPKYVWHRNDRDDWCLATCYWRVGMDRFAEQSSEFIGDEDKYSDVPFAPTVNENGLMNYTELV